MKKLIWLVGILLLMAGCQKAESITIAYDEDRLFNMAEAEDYIVYVDQEVAMVEEKTSGESYPLIIDPLHPEDTRFNFTSNWKTSGNLVYFQNGDEISVIDLDTGKKKLLYTDTVPLISIELLGVTLWKNYLPSKYTTTDFMTDFFIVDNAIVIIRSESITVFRNGKESSLCDGSFGTVTGGENGVFFTDDLGLLHYIQPFTWEEAAIPEIYAGSMTTHDDLLYYVDNGDHYKVKSVNPTTGEICTVYSESCQMIVAGYGFILLQDRAGTLQIMRLSNGKTEMISLSEHFSRMSFLENGNSIVVNSQNAENERGYVVFDNPLL